MQEEKKIQNAVQIELLLLFETSVPLETFFSHSQEAAQSLFILLLVPLRSSPNARHISSPSPPSHLVFQFQTGRLLLRPSGIRSAARSVSERLAEHRAVALRPLLHVRSFFFPPAAVHFSFIHFEVEFLHLCLSLPLQWLDANPSLTFSSFSTSYAPRL